MMTVGELFQDALQYEESLTAHAVSIGIRKGLWSPADPESVIDWTRLDMDEVTAARDRNDLGLNPVKLYSAPLGDSRFAIIMAETSQDASTAFSRALKRQPRVIHHLPHGMDVTTYENDLSDAQTWREIRNEMNAFPAVAGIYHKGAI